jgi:PAS domain S-box-containing protein
MTVPSAAVPGEPRPLTGLPDGADLQPVNILVVDDQPSVLAYLKEVLLQPAQNLVVAESGERALALLAEQEFALVLLDIAMPGMDGFEVAVRLRQNQSGRTTPILFVTSAADNMAWRFQAYAVGGVDFISKPFDRHVVRGKVAVFVELYRQRRQLLRQAVRLQEIEREERAVELASVKAASERRFRHLAEALPNVVWTATEEGRIGYFNRRWREATGLGAAASAGYGWLTAVHQDDRQRLLDSWRRAAQESRELEVECRLRDSAGADRWYLCRALPEPGDQGQSAHWFGSFTDVDEQRKAHERSRAALRLRDEFLAIAAHELRTPLTSARLQVDHLNLLLESAPDLPRVRSKVKGVDRQLVRLTSLVERLLDASQISAGPLQLSCERFDVMEMIIRLGEAFAPEALAAGCELRVSGGPPIFGCWDRVRLEQAIGNLLSNAIKYGSRHPISLDVQQIEDAIQISVQDHGIGIEAESVERIFGKFERAASARNYSGLGLGLWLSSEIAVAHGGTVVVSSELGSGSLFKLTVPVDGAAWSLAVAATAAAVESTPVQH